MNAPLALRVAVAVVLSAACTPSHAETEYNWEMAADGLWSTSGSWSIPGFPGTVSDIAIIDRFGNYTVILDVDATIGGLSIANFGATLSTGTRNLRVAGAVDFQFGTISGNAIGIDSGSLAIT